MKKVVYFNQWFSSISNVIDDLKNKYGDKIAFVASSVNKDHAYKNSVDYFVVEDWESEFDTDATMKNYTDWVLNLCEQYEVDIFFVKKYAKYIMARYEDFEELGVKLISDSYDILNMMEQKSTVYGAVSTDVELHRYIPEYHIFTRVDAAMKYVNNHRGKSDLCLKFNSDEGGASFRHINDSKIDLESLYKFRVNELTTDEVIDMLSCCSDKTVQKLMFMELLDSPEISVDCYNSKKGFIAIARVKINGRKQKIFYDKEISKLCEKIGNTIGLKHPYNVQFRVKQGGDVTNINDLRLLEINPRMSGGLYYETLLNMNLAEICLKDVLGEYLDDDYNISTFTSFEPSYVTHVEKAIILS